MSIASGDRAALDPSFCPERQTRGANRLFTTGDPIKLVTPQRRT
jgi:hypothetical protein